MMILKNLGFIQLVFFILIVSSCTLEPEFTRPVTKASQKFIFVNQESISVSANSTVKWWERFGDKNLNDYVEVLLRDNLSLKESFQRVLQAKQQVNMDRGGLFPTVSLGVDSARNFQPTNSFAIPRSGTSSNSRFFTNSFGADVNASWELDLFGRIQNSIQSSQADLVASEFDSYALEQSLIAQLVKLRIASLVNNQMLSTAQKSVENQQKIYALTKRRYNLGVQSVNASDVYLAQKNLHASKAEMHSVRRELAQNLYAFDVLLGKHPGTTKIDVAIDKLPILPKAALTCLPISLLDRRPDLKASEFRLMAQNAGIGVAMADLYPNLSISGSIGYSSMKSSRFIASDQLAGSLLSSVTTKIFQGGALRANVRLQKEKAKEMAINYSYQALEALKEVEVALQADGALKRELLQKKKSLALLQKSQANKENRYRLGIGNLKDFLQSKQDTYQANQEWLQAFKSRFDGRIDVYLSLGGDWHGDSKALTNKCLLTKIRK